jgi:hypothetical protein
MGQEKHRRDGVVGVIELDNPHHRFMTTRMVREHDAITVLSPDDAERVGC